MRVLLLRYGWSVVLRLWIRLRWIRPEVRLCVSAASGAAVAPFVVFIGPMARLYWLMTGRHLPWPLGVTAPRRYVVVDPFEATDDTLPSDIRELFERHGQTGERDPTNLPRWMDAWARVGQLLNWNLPVGYRTRQPQPPPSSR